MKKTKTIEDNFKKKPQVNPFEGKGKYLREYEKNRTKVETGRCSDEAK